MSDIFWDKDEFITQNILRLQVTYSCRKELSTITCHFADHYQMCHVGALQHTEIIMRTKTKLKIPWEMHSNGAECKKVHANTTFF